MNQTYFTSVSWDELKLLLPPTPQENLVASDKKSIKLNHMEYIGLSWDVLSPPP